MSANGSVSHCAPQFAVVSAAPALRLGSPIELTNGPVSVLHSLLLIARPVYAGAGEGSGDTPEQIRFCCAYCGKRASPSSRSPPYEKTMSRRASFAT